MGIDGKEGSVIVRNSMLSNRCGLILAFLVVALRCSSVPQQTVAEVVKRSGDAVVQIVISDSDGQETALGSGFLISADGEVVTNFHVIKDAHSAVVKLSTGAFFPVSGILASDSDRDLAILKIKGNRLPFLALGSDSKPQ
ncbi:MAG: trypsin-like peptidase domain-containing protein, partial [Terracidiphilus sp.]